MTGYEMYVCLKKETYAEKVPNKLKAKLGDNTWEEAAIAGHLGIPRFSDDGKYIIVKGQFSMKEGELSAIAELGASMDYPDNCVLTQAEALSLANSDKFIVE